MCRKKNGRKRIWERGDSSGSAGKGGSRRWTSRGEEWWLGEGCHCLGCVVVLAFAALLRHDMHRKPARRPPTAIERSRNRPQRRSAARLQCREDTREPPRQLVGSKLEFGLPLSQDPELVWLAVQQRGGPEREAIHLRSFGASPPHRQSSLQSAPPWRTAGPSCWIAGAAAPHPARPICFYLPAGGWSRLFVDRTRHRGPAVVPHQIVLGRCFIAIHSFISSFALPFTLPAPLYFASPLPTVIPTSAK